ncbi:MAG TPA: O-antigen ligase family protein [Clostridia bacterium]|nr:O-antigen ligase family protein [Clostridia bacterium]
MIFSKLLAVFLLLLPTQLSRHFWLKDSYLFGLKIDYLSPTFYLQDALFFLLVFFWLRNGSWKKLNSKIWRFGLVFFLIAALNMAFSPTPLVSLFFWLRVTELFFLGLIIFQNHSKVFSLLGKILPWVLIWEFFLGLAQVLKSSSLGGFFWFLGERSFNLFTPGIARAAWRGKILLRPYGTFSHPNSLAGFALISLILILGKERLLRKDKLGLLAGGALILLSFSRTVWLTAFVLGLVFLITRLVKAWGRKAFPLTFSYLSVIFFLLLSLYFFSQTTIDPASFQRRKDLAEFALTSIRQKPIFGVGGNHFIISLAQARPVWQWLYWLQPVHNIFLLVASELGLLGLLFFAFLIFKSLNSLFVICDSPATAERKRQAWALAVALIAILLTGLFDHYWLTLIQNQLLLVIIFSLSIAATSDKIS